MNYFEEKNPKYLRENQCLQVQLKKKLQIEQFMNQIKETLKGYSIIWVDANVQNQENLQYQTCLVNKVRNLHALQTVQSYEQLAIQIEQNQKQESHNYVVIVSGALSEELINASKKNQQFIQTILIFCGVREKYLHWIEKDKRVRMVQNNFAQILKFLEWFEEDLKTSQIQEDGQTKQSSQLIMPTINYYLNTGESKIKYLLYEFFFQVIELDEKKDISIIKEGFRLEAENYIKKKQLQNQQGNLQQFLDLIKIDGIKEDQCLIWFQKKNCFLRSMLLEAVQSSDFLELFKMRLILSTLNQQIKNYQGWKGNPPLQQVFVGLCVTNKELDKWKKKDNNFILFDFYAYGSLKRENALLAGKKKLNNVRTELLVLEVSIPEDTNQRPCQLKNAESEEEILFPLNSLLQIHSIEKIDSYNFVKASLEGKESIQSSIKSDQTLFQQQERLKKLFGIILKKQYKFENLTLSDGFLLMGKAKEALGFLALPLLSPNSNIQRWNLEARCHLIMGNFSKVSRIYEKIMNTTKQNLGGIQSEAFYKIQTAFWYSQIMIGQIPLELFQQQSNYELKFKNKNEELSQFYYCLSIAHYLKKNIADAFSFAQRAIKLIQNKLVEQNFLYEEQFIFLTELQYELKDYSYTTQLQRMYQDSTMIFGENHYISLRLLAQIGQYNLQGSQLPLGVFRLCHCLERFKEMHEKHPFAAEVYIKLAKGKLEGQQLERPGELLAKAKQIYDEQFGNGNLYSEMVSQLM